MPSRKTSILSATRVPMKTVTCQLHVDFDNSTIQRAPNKQETTLFPSKDYMACGPNHLHAALIEGSAAAQLCESETRARKSHKASSHQDDFPSHDRGVGAYIPVPWLTQNSFLGGVSRRCAPPDHVSAAFSKSSLCHPT